MAEYPVGALSRAGERIPLFVNDDGSWLAKAAGRDLEQPTRPKLVAEIDRMLRLEKKAVHIPITVVGDRRNGYAKVNHGVVTGLHAGTGNLMVAWDSGSTGQLVVGGHGTEVLQRLTPDEEVKLAHLTKAAHAAADALRDFTHRKEIYRGTKGLAEQVKKLLTEEGQ